MELFDAIKGRRSIRKYKPKPVSEEDLNKILEAGRWAASWANTQCWRFIIVKDKIMKEKLRDTLSPTNPARDAVIQAPVIIVACGVRGLAGYHKGEPKTDKGDWFMFDSALALSNITHMAYSLGLGTVHVGLFDAKKVEELLEVPEGVSVVEIIPLGYPDETPSPPPRKELSEIVFYERYKRR